MIHMSKVTDTVLECGVSEQGKPNPLLSWSFILARETDHRERAESCLKTSHVPRLAAEGSTQKDEYLQTGALLFLRWGAGSSVGSGTRWG